MINFFLATFFIFYESLEFLTGACQTPTEQEMSIFHLCAVLRYIPRPTTKQWAADRIVSSLRLVPPQLPWIFKYIHINLPGNWWQGRKFVTYFIFSSHISHPWWKFWTSRTWVNVSLNFCRSRTILAQERTQDVCENFKIQHKYKMNWKSLSYKKNQKQTACL